MAHLWQVPGWESSWGLFSGENPALNLATSDVGELSSVLGWMRTPPAPPASARASSAGGPAQRGEVHAARTGILGHKVTIVSDKPQTTRHRIRGVLTRDDVQVVFVDTPASTSPARPWASG